MFTQHIKNYSQNIAPNTFIGGVGATINSKNLLAERLLINPNRILGFKMYGLNIECRILGTYNVQRPDGTSIFPNSLTYFRDVDQLINRLYIWNFTNMINLEVLEVYGVQNIIGGYSKISYTKLEELNFPNITTGSFGTYDIRYNSNLKRFLAPNYTGANGDYFLADSPKMELIDMRKTKQVGRTPNRPPVFTNVGSTLIPGIGKFHEDIVSVAIDGGNPDVNMMRLYNKGWKIELYNDAGVYVGDFTI